MHEINETMIQIALKSINYLDHQLTCITGNFVFRLVSNIPLEMLLCI